MDSRWERAFGGALMRDMRTDISIIFQKRNSKSMVQGAVKGQKTQFLIHISGCAAYTAKNIYIYI